VIKRKSILITAVVGIAIGLLGTAASAQAAPFVYVANLLSGNVSQYDAASGGLSPLSPAMVAAGNRPFWVAVTPDGQNVYVTNSGDGTVSQYSVGAGGVLSAKSPATIAAGSNPGGVAVSPDGHNVYVANLGTARGGGSVSQYSVGAGGVLSAKSPAAVLGGGNWVGVAVSPDGTSVYVTSLLNAFVEQLLVGADGTLSPNSEVTAGSGSSGVVVSPDGASVYVTNDGDNSVSQYSVFAGGALSMKSPPMVAAGFGPEGIAIGPAVLVPATKAQCKNNGWRNFPQFKNQGQCIGFYNDGP
jgi:DNA-binding beta-propeller fold protein YncE